MGIVSPGLYRRHAVSAGCAICATRSIVRIRVGCNTPEDWFFVIIVQLCCELCTHDISITSSFVHAPLWVRGLVAGHSIPTLEVYYGYSLWSHRTYVGRAIRLFDDLILRHALFVCAHSRRAIMRLCVPIRGSGGSTPRTIRRIIRVLYPVDKGYYILRSLFARLCEGVGSLPGMISKIVPVSMRDFGSR